MLLLLLLLLLLSLLPLLLLLQLLLLLSLFLLLPLLEASSPMTNNTLYTTPSLQTPMYTYCCSRKILIVVQVFSIGL